MTIDTAIMMVTYNRLELTKETIKSIFSLNRPHNLIIVDNGSTDGTPDYLTNLRYNGSTQSIILYHNKENLGIAIGRNQALKIANDLNTKWFCTLDNDVIVPPHFLDEAIEIMEKNPKYGAIGANMEGKDYPLITENGKTFQLKQAGNLGTAAMVMSRSAHKMVGYFNTQYNAYGLEDSDMGMRIRVAGFKLAYIKDNGKHLGVGEHDTGEYRKWKTQQHDSLVHVFI